MTMGRFDKAEKLLVKAVAMYQSETGQDSETVAQVVNRLGSLYLTLSNFSVRSLYAQTLTLQGSRNLLPNSIKNKSCQIWS